MQENLEMTDEEIAFHKRRNEKIKRYELTNAFRNFNTVFSGRENIKTVNDLEHKKNKPVIIVGSGVSLNDAVKHLKSWKHDIICSTSQFSTLVYYGIKPTYISVTDPYSFEDEYLIPDWKVKYKFIFPVGINYKIIKMLDELDQFIYFFIRAESGKEYAENIWTGYSSFIFDGNYEYEIKENVPKFDSSVVSMNFQIKLAEILGYDPIILIGADLVIDRSDFVYFDKEKREWIYVSYDRKYKGQSMKIWDKIKKHKKSISREVKYKGKLTTNILLWLKYDLDEVIKDRKNVINCSGGVLDGNKYNFEEILNKYNKVEV